MSETPVERCEVCGRDLKAEPHDPFDSQCAKDGVWIRQAALAEARAALSAAEKERDEWRARKETTEAMWKSCTRQVADERDAAEKREARLREALAGLMDGFAHVRACRECGESDVADCDAPMAAAALVAFNAARTLLEASETSARSAPQELSESRPPDPPETA